MTEKPKEPKLDTPLGENEEIRALSVKINDLEEKITLLQKEKGDYSGVINSLKEDIVLMRQTLATKIKEENTPDKKSSQNDLDFLRSFCSWFSLFLVFTFTGCATIKQPLCLFACKTDCHENAK